MVCQKEATILTLSVGKSHLVMAVAMKTTVVQVILARCTVNGRGLGQACGKKTLRTTLRYRIDRYEQYRHYTRKYALYA